MISLGTNGFSIPTCAAAAILYGSASIAAIRYLKESKDTALKFDDVVS